MGGTPTSDLDHPPPRVLVGAVRSRDRKCGKGGWNNMPYATSATTLMGEEQRDKEKEWPTGGVRKTTIDNIGYHVLVLWIFFVTGMVLGWIRED